MIIVSVEVWLESFINFKCFSPRWYFVSFQLKGTRHIFFLFFLCRDRYSVMIHHHEYVASHCRSVRPRCALRRQWSCLIRRRRTRGAPQNIYPLQKGEERGEENASWADHTAEMSSGWTDAEIDAWQTRVKTILKCFLSAKPGWEGGRRCEDGSPAML